MAGNKKGSKYLLLGGKTFGVTQAMADYVRSQIVVETSTDSGWNDLVGAAIERLVQDIGKLYAIQK
ncbi:MAG: hypothetical protein COA43_08110 [Robiginitomaculum sp.]|nr:MAG: hypothetical protein COA43_08110 [Robiginitomaculum sp.]